MGKMKNRKTRVLLISANTEQINMPVLPVGLAGVAASLESAGHAVKLVNLMAVENTGPVVAKSVSDFEPDAIGVSVRNIDDQAMENPKFLLDDVKRIVSECKSCSNAPVILGGAGYSIFPQSCLAFLGADMGIAGEGEKALPEILHRMEKEENLDGYPGLHLPGKTQPVKPERIESLDSYPLPRPGTLIDPEDESETAETWLPIQTRRGCAMKCLYCSTPAIEGTLLRRRDPARVVDAMRAYVDAGVNRFYFTDNTFNLPYSYAETLCEKIIEAGLNVSCRGIVYPRNIDASLAEKMAAAGFKEVALGFESGSAKMLKNLKKRFSPADVRQVSETLKRFGIARLGFLLLGGPEETRETVSESIRFAESLELEAMKVTAGIRIYPDTQLARIAAEQNLISLRDDLLRPKFYLTEKLGEWLNGVLKECRLNHRNWFV